MLDNDIPHRSWQVLLLGGPSGAGKTSVSYRLAHHFRIGITEVDDFQVILERMTTPTEQPVLHYWRTILKLETSQQRRLSNAPSQLVR